MTGVEPSVLVVEDDAMVRGWVRLSLRDSEFRIAGEAEDAVQALALVERRRPDVMLVRSETCGRGGAATGSAVGAPPASIGSDA